MISANRIGDSITGHINGEPFGVSYTDERYANMQSLEAQANQAQTMEELTSVLDQFRTLLKEDYSDVMAHAKGGEYLYVNRHTGQFFLRMPNGNISQEPAPARLADRIILSVEKNMAIEPLVKFWVRFLRGPKYSRDKAQRAMTYLDQMHTSTELKQKLLQQGLSELVARERATTYQNSFTLEGLIVGYKVSLEIERKFVKDEQAEGGVKEVDRYDYEVDELTGLKTYTKPNFVEDRVFEPACMHQNGDEFYCGTLEEVDGGTARKGHVIKVGRVHALESWDQVDCNDHRSCVPGLHVGNLDYIRGYQNSGTVTHNVLIDPMHIGAVLLDNTGAMRVKQYFVHSSFAGVNRNLYHSSRYAALTDKEFMKQLEEAVATVDKERRQKLSRLEELKG